MGRAHGSFSGNLQILTLQCLAFFSSQKKGMYTNPGSPTFCMFRSLYTLLLKLAFLRVRIAFSLFYYNSSLDDRNNSGRLIHGRGLLDNKDFFNISQCHPATYRSAHLSLQVEWSVSPRVLRQGVICRVWLISDYSCLSVLCGVPRCLSGAVRQFWPSF